MAHCVVPLCPSNWRNKKIRDVSYHRFPKNPMQLRKWLVKIKNKQLSVHSSWNVVKYKRVCSRHFVSEDIEYKYFGPRRPKQKRLKKNAVPSLFDFIPQMQTSSESETEEQTEKIKICVNQNEDLDTSFVSDAGNLSVISDVNKSFLVASESDENSKESDFEQDFDENISKWAVVDIANVLKLFTHCFTCYETLVMVKPKFRGAQLIILWQCINSHEGTWEGCSNIRGMPEINLCLSASTLFSGNTFQSLSNFFHVLEAGFIQKSSYHSIQNAYLLPVIQDEYALQQNQIIAELILRSIEGEKICLAGDGRSDSPGFSAKYTSYSFMDEETAKVVDLQLVQVTETTSSVAMEKLGFERSIEFLLDHGINIRRVTTDRSPSIKKLMKDKYSDIDHQFDCWHICKGVKKKIIAVGKRRGHEELLAWTKSITNHLWYCSSSCGGDKQALIARWESILMHVVDTHEWEDIDGIHQCMHATLTMEERERKAWLNSDSLAYRALANIVKDTRLKKDLEQLTAFSHTGNLESFHSTITKFAPKRIHFHYDAMKGRLQLATLDHNNNIGRSQAKTSDGKPMFKIACAKQSGGTWSVRKVFEGKSLEYTKSLLQKTLKRRKDPSVSLTDVRSVPRPNLPPNIAPVQRPSREELLEEHAARS